MPHRVTAIQTKPPGGFRRAQLGLNPGKNQHLQAMEGLCPLGRHPEACKAQIPWEGTSLARAHGLRAWQFNTQKYLYSVYLAALLWVTVATGFIFPKPGLACDVLGKEQPRGEGGMKFSTLGGALGCSRGDRAVSLAWGQPPALPRLCPIPFAPAAKGRFGFRGSMPVFCWLSQDTPTAVPVCQTQALVGRGADGFPDVWNRVPSPGAAEPRDSPRQRKDLRHLHQNLTRVGFQALMPPRTCSSQATAGNLSLPLKAPAQAKIPYILLENSIPHALTPLSLRASKGGCPIPVCPGATPSPPCPPAVAAGRRQRATAARRRQRQ